MKIKSTIIAAAAIVLLAGCAGTEKRIIDGKEREVFFSPAVGLWTKDGETLDSFNAVSRPCQEVALKNQSANHLDRLIPYNYNAKRRHFIAVTDEATACLKAAGFIFVDHSRNYKLMKEQQQAQ